MTIRSGTLGITKRLAALSAMLMCAVVFAAPAPWYLWRSELNGKLFCSQVPPGEGWEKAGGPFKDARCKHPGAPGE
jgi:hypothetical protein